MSRENVEPTSAESTPSTVETSTRFWDEVDPEIELHASLPAMLGGESTVSRGHEEIREWFRDLVEAFAEFQIEISEIRDLG